MREIFPMIPPATNTVTWIMVAVTALMGGLALLFTYFALTMGKASFEVSSEGLRLRGDLYGRLIPAQSLQVEQAQIVNLNHDASHQLKLRTMGTSVPGHQAGWFRLNNGEKALVYLTDRSRVVYLPTRNGYSVMLSTPQPEAFLAALQRIAVH
jgi:Bacterial PH domain